MFSPPHDFPIFDRTETLTWHRPCSEFSAEIPAALRLSTVQSVSPSSPSEEDEAIWVFPKHALSAETPVPGDFLADTHQDRWIITKIQNYSVRDCWKCTAVHLLRHFGLKDLLDVYRPCWSLDENGVPVPEYHLFRPGIPAKIVPPEIGSRTDFKTGSETSFKTDSEIEIHVVAPELILFPRDQLVTPFGQIFRVLQFRPARSWSEVSKIFCQEINS
ncbi:MAG: hypothetical protein Q4C70_11540 [Planctomycetia bacterium]|nr:hypothetical protein [Planctomycetia bacterium]